MIRPVCTLMISLGGILIIALVGTGEFEEPAKTWCSRLLSDGCWDYTLHLIIYLLPDGLYSKLVCLD